MQTNIFSEAIFFLMGRRCFTVQDSLHCYCISLLPRRIPSKSSNSTSSLERFNCPKNPTQPYIRAVYPRRITLISKYPNSHLNREIRGKISKESSRETETYQNTTHIGIHNFPDFVFSVPSQNIRFQIKFPIVQVDPLRRRSSYIGVGVVFQFSRFRYRHLRQVTNFEWKLPSG